MDQQERIFYEQEVDFFGQSHLCTESHILPLISNESLDNRQQLGKSTNNQEQKEVSYFKAYNPLDRLKDIPEDKHNQYLFLFNNHKYFNGIQHFFEFGQDDKFSGEFLENIESDAFGNNANKNFQLDKLFLGQQPMHNEKQNIENTKIHLNYKMKQINQKITNNMNINKTISNAFYEHFQNYSLVMGESTFLKEFQHSLKNMIQYNKKLKGPGIQLISTIYQFWIKSFKDFTNQIWKYSSKFTLNFFKKQQNQNGYEKCQSEIRSQSSNTIQSKDKRKGWSAEQTQVLQELINSNIIFSQSVLRKLSSQFNRSISSISSKIQKIMKSKKGEDNQEESLLRKAVQILKLYSKGLHRQSIIQKLNESYEMGYGGQWQKSVGQLLSNRKEFIKIKSKPSLLNPQHYKQIDFNDYDQSKISFKDKVIQIFLSCPNAEADLKTLVDLYIKFFQEEEFLSQSIMEERRKTIQSNITKTLSRYEIFDGKSKIIYLLNPLFLKIQNKNMQAQVQQFFTL